MLTRILRKDWYPKLAAKKRVMPKVEEVIDNMLNVLPKMNSLKTIQDICEMFMNVERQEISLNRNNSLLMLRPEI